MPSSPEIRDAFRRIRIIKVLHKLKSQSEELFRKIIEAKFCDLLASWGPRKTSGVTQSELEELRTGGANDINPNSMAREDLCLSLSR